MMFEGHCNTAVVEAWIYHELRPLLKKGQTVIMDNARFHKSKNIEKMIIEAGCELLYLPSYSPDFNEIEHQWFPIKNKIRKYISHSFSLEEAVQNAFK